MPYKKYKAVHILGLYKADLQTDNIDSVEHFHGDEVWSMTDWYRSYPWLTKLDRHFDVHGAVESMDRRFWKEKDKDRFPGDWKQRYRDCGAKMVAWDRNWPNVLGLPEERFIWLDYDELENKYGEEPMSSSASIMVLEAIEADFERIWLHGLHMVGTAHEPYVPGLMRAMEIARSKGIKVTANYEYAWGSETKNADIGNYARMCKEHQDNLKNVKSCLRS